MSHSDSDEPSRKPERRRRRNIFEEEDDLDNDFDELENLIQETEKTQNSIDNESNDELDEEDLNLIAENTGIDIKKAKRKRIVVADSDDDEHPLPQSQSRIQQHFDMAKRKKEDSSHYEQPFDDIDDFIVSDADDDDADQVPTRRTAPFSHIRSGEAADIFGEEFDAEELEDLGQEALPPGQFKNLKDMYEPAQLEQTHMTEKDVNIRLIDIPERMQRRAKEVTDFSNDDELDEESYYIYRQGLYKLSFLKIDNSKQSLRGESLENTLKKIKNVLVHIRTEKYEVPFIMHYRKESYQPELKPSDLWKIYDMDIEFMNLKERRHNLTQLMRQMFAYQKYFSQNAELDSSYYLGDPIEEDHIDRASKLYSIPEIKDAYDSFSFNHLHILRDLYSSIKANETLCRNESLNIIDINPAKLPASFNCTSYVKKTGLNAIIDLFGLTPYQFAQNMVEQYPHFVPDRTSQDPRIIASRLMSEYFSSDEMVLNKCSTIWGLALAHNPIVRSQTRFFYYENAKISCGPTSKGSVEIDENHPYAEFKYLRLKPINTISPQMYLKLLAAESEGLIKIDIISTNEQGQSILEVCRPFCERDEYAAIIQEYNKLRYNGIKHCFEKILLPSLSKELRNHLYIEAQEYICSLASQVFIPHINFCPDNSKSQVGYIFGISMPPYQGYGNVENGGSCAILSSDGTFVECFDIDNILFSDPSRIRGHRFKFYETILAKFLTKVVDFAPGFIIFSLNGMDTIWASKRLKTIIFDEMKTKAELPIVEIVNGLIPNACATSKAYTVEFPNYTYHVRCAISSVRYSLDPLVEVVQLFENQEDASSLILHSMHRHLNRDLYFKYLERQVIDNINLSGVDIHRCYGDQRYSNILKYVSGLGCAKAAYMLFTLRKNPRKIMSRSDLITQLQMGPKVFINCAGFIKIPINLEFDDDVEPFENSRIHPESYDIARQLISKMYDVNSSDISSLTESLLDLQSNDLKAIKFDLINFTREYFPNKRDSLKDILDELCNPYVDHRRPFLMLRENELFWCIASDGIYMDKSDGSDPDVSIAINRIITVTVTRILYKKPSKYNVNDTVIKSEADNKFRCPFCLDRTYLSIDLVWEHVNKDCPGYIFGINVRLDCGLNGFISKENLLDIGNNSFTKKYNLGMCISARVLSVNESRYSVELSAKLTESSMTKPKEKKDKFYDIEREQARFNLEKEKKEKERSKVTYKKKLIVHPLFKNITFEDAERFLTSENLDCIIRPSSKGTDILGLSIRIYENIIVHLNIKEEEKLTEYTIGKKLILLNECYEDLDEIHSRFVVPYLGYFRELFKHKNYFYVPESDRFGIENELKQLIDENNKRIPYLFSLSKSYPGKVYLAYLPKNMVKYEYISVSNYGYRIRNTLHKTVDSVISYFKTVNKEDNFVGYESSKSHGIKTPRSHDSRLTSSGLRSSMKT